MLMKTERELDWRNHSIVIKAEWDLRRGFKVNEMFHHVAVQILVLAHGMSSSGAETTGQG